MIKSNPFTPQSGWEPKVFGGRSKQIEAFSRVMREAVAGRPNHMVVLGEWGIGKTSLLKQFKKITQGKGYLASFCSIVRFTERDTVQDGISLISEEMVDETEWEQAFKNALRELGRDYFEALYRRASGREETILLTLAKAKTNFTIAETAKTVGAKHKDFPLKNVKHFLYRLENKGLIKRTETRSFTILDPMFREYVLLKQLGWGQD